MSSEGFILPASFLNIDGPDSRRFLQGQLTCDLTQLQPGSVVPGACCDLKGRVLAFFHILCVAEQHFLIRSAPEVCGALAAHLQKYSVFFKCQMQHSEGLIRGADQGTGTVYPASIDALSATEYWQPESDGPAADPAGAWHYYSRWHAQGIPRLHSNLTGRYTPHALGLVRLGAVSFNKGCYTGQEIVARMHYRGKDLKTLVHFTAEVSSDPTPTPGHKSEVREHALQIEWVDCLLGPDRGSFLGIADPSAIRALSGQAIHLEELPELALYPHPFS